MALVATPRTVAAGQQAERTSPHHRLGVHVVLLGVLLTLAFPLMSPSSAFTLDEGAYALQADALQNGRWTYDYRAAPLDPSGRHVPITLSASDGQRHYPYIQHPAYSLLLKLASDALGPTLGLHFWALLGALGVAVAAWLIAGEIGPGLRPWAFWLAAAGPALANAYIIWAHSLSAALAGLTLVGAVRIAKHGLNGPRAVLVAAGGAGGVLLRSEGLLFALAVGLALAVATAGPLRRRLTTAGLVLPALASAFLERAWIHRIAGNVYDNLETRAADGGFLTSRISGAWHDLFQASSVGLVGLVVVVAFGLVSLRRWRPDSLRLLTVAVVAGVTLGVAQFVTNPTQPVSGLFAACPVLLLGVLLVPWKTAGPTERVLGLTAAAFIPAVVATAYAAGGGLEWGGRFYAPLLAPLAVLAVAGLAHRLHHARCQQRPATALLVALTATGALLTLLTVGSVRHMHREANAAVVRHPAALTVTTVAAFPKVAWAENDRITWMLAEHKQLPDLLAHLRSHGVTNVTVVTDSWVRTDLLSAFPNVRSRPEPALTSLGLTLFELHA